MIKTVIVEDEPLSRKLLESYCEKSGMITICASFPSASEALPFLNQQEMDLVFLDVEMPGLDGFEMLDQLLYMPKIILTTSKTEYAFKAFQYDVVDYLKKPVQYNRFLASLHKVRDKEAPAEGKPTQEEDFFIKSSGKFIRLRYDDILFVESLGDYVKYVSEEKAYVVHSTMKMVEESLAGRSFVKVHRSYIVNLNKVRDMEDSSIMVAGKSIPVSKGQKSEVIRRLKPH